MPAPPLTSPSTTYSGPPPPYSYPSSASSSIVGTNNAVTAPPATATYSFSQHRSAFGDEKDRIHIPPKLPPINEAISSIHSLLNTSPSARPSQPAPSPTSPTSPTHRPPIEPRDQPRTESYQRQSPRSARSFDSKPAMLAFSPQVANYNSNHLNNHVNQLPSSQAPRSIADYVSHHGNISSHQSSQIPPPPPTHTSPITTEPTSYPSAYQYQPAYSYPPSTPGASALERSFFEPIRNGHTIDQDRAEEYRKAIPKDSPTNKAYGAEVKRHLDNFEFETSLNEVSVVRGW